MNGSANICILEKLFTVDKDQRAIVEDQLLALFTEDKKRNKQKF